MRSRATFWIGSGGIIIGAFAFGTEALPVMGVEQSTQAAWFRALSWLAVLTILSALLFAVVGLARTVEDQPTRVQPIVDAFLAGIDLGHPADGGEPKIESGGSGKSSDAAT